MFENFERVTTKKVTQFMITRKLIANIWRTPTGEILQSKHRHDMQVDSAGNYIDGGIEGYTRRGGDILNEKWENLCVYADDPHEKIREVFIWKSYGKNFSQPEGVYTLLKDLTDDHIIAICETQTHLPEYILEMFRNEQTFRKENSNE